MDLKYRIQGFVMASGERYCLLVEPDSGSPLFHPNLFVTTQVRNRSLSVSAMEAALVAVNVLLTFCGEHGIDLDARCCRRHLLKTSELDALRDHCQLRFGKRESRRSPIVSLGRRGVKRTRRLVGLSTEFMRLTHIANYMGWLTNTLLGSSVDELTARRIESVRKGLFVRRPMRKRRNALDDARGLSKKQLATLQKVIAADGEASLFKDVGTRKRNRLILDVLLYLGVRGGELLNIRIRDIDWPRHQLVIARRPDEVSDPRARQPLVKTLDRRIPLRETLVEELHAYVVNYRNKIPGARKHDYLFVTHKSGPTQGQPLSISTYQKVIKAVAGSSPELENFHGHLLRHTWNDRFSEQMDQLQDPPSPEQQEAMRAYAQGWKAGSGTGATYNRRFTERMAHEAQLKLQKKTLRMPEGLEDE
jgi:integrase